MKRTISDRDSDTDVPEPSHQLPDYCLAVYRVVGRLDGQVYGVDERCCKLLLLFPPELVDTLKRPHSNDPTNSSTNTLDSKRRKTADHTPHLRSISIFMDDFQFPLPTESPLVLYDLLVRQLPCRQSFQVLAVNNVDLYMKSVTKEWLVDYCRSHWNLKRMKQFKKALARLPEKTPITSLIVCRYVFDQKWAPRLAALVCIVEKPPSFFFLLRFFHATVLCKLTNSQLDFMSTLLQSCPHIFCFRALLEKILQHPVIFPGEKGLAKWKIAREYSLARPDLMMEDERRVDIVTGRLGFREQMLWRPTGDSRYLPTYFNPRHPLLPFRFLETFYKGGLVPPFPLDILHDSLKIFLEFDAYNAKGFPSYLINQTNKHVAAILTTNLGIFTDIGNGRYMLQDDSMIESLFSDTLCQFSSSVDLYETSWYNKEYCRQLGAWISKNPSLLQTGLFYTFSFSWEIYLQTHSKVNFWNAQKTKLSLKDRVSITNRLQLIKQARQNRPENNDQDVAPRKEYYILVEHTHKFSVERLLGLFWSAIDFLVQERNIAIDTIAIKCIFLGDSEDLPVYYQCGTGDIWSDLTKVFPKKILKFKTGVSREILSMREKLLSCVQQGIEPKSRNETPALAKDMLKKKRYLSNPRFAPVVTISETEIADEDNDTEMNDDIHNSTTGSSVVLTATAARKKHRGVKERNTVQLLCSGKQEQRSLSNTLDKVRSSKYNEHKIFVRDKVGILENGAQGIVKRIYRLNRDGTRTDIGKRIGASLHMATWTMRICPCALATKCECNHYYTTNNYTIYHNGVDIMQMRQGVPTSYVLFYVSRNTKRAHLLAALKYCTMDIFIFILHQLPFSSIYEEKNLKDGRRISDLSTKLRSWQKN